MTVQGRHLLLREVGVAGEARLAATDAVVPAGPAHDLEALYLAASGVQVRRGPAAPRPFPHGEAFRHDAARNVAAQAWRALDVMRAALGLPRGPTP